MDLIKVVKSNFGSIGGLAGSKKFAITVAFVSVALSYVATASDVVVKVAAMAAAGAATMSYVVVQGIVEARAAGRAKTITPKR